MTKCVYIIDGNYQYTDLFYNAGYCIADNFEEADVICFTGGEDVDPSIYGHKKHSHTYSNICRDLYEKRLFDKAVASNKNIVGICRGSQFLNVMNGGVLNQHITKHAVADGHLMSILATGKQIKVSSTHHQQMRIGKGAVVLGEAYLNSIKNFYDPEMDMFAAESMSPDMEVVYYPQTKSICFQPHPEYRGFPDCTAYFYSLLEEYF